MCMASHIYEYTQQTTHRVATNTTRRPLFHRAPEDEDDRGAHSKAKEFILGISVCCLCFLKLVNLDLDLDLLLQSPLTELHKPSHELLSGIHGASAKQGP